MPPPSVPNQNRTVLVGDERLHVVARETVTPGEPAEGARGEPRGPAVRGGEPEGAVRRFGDGPQLGTDAWDRLESAAAEPVGTAAGRDPEGAVPVHPNGTYGTRGEAVGFPVGDKARAVEA